MNRTYEKEIESVCDYSLPDYLGDVKKILTVTATAIPSGKFASNGEVNFSGVVSYDILYVDSEDKLTALTLSSDYDVAVPVCEDEYIDSIDEARVSSVAVRLTGPRKMTAKAIVANNVNLLLEDNFKYVGDAFKEGCVAETLSKVIKVEKTVFASSAEREYAEEAERLDGVTADEIEILASSGSVRISESEVGKDGVVVRGEIIITSIVRTTEQPPFAIKKIIPFEETINFEGISPDMKVSVDGYLTSVTAGVSEDAEGSAITVNAISELYCIASENKDVSVMTDAYIKNRDSAAKYEDVEYSTIVCASTTESKISAEVKREDIGCENARDILKLTAEVKNLEKNITQSGFCLCGDAVFCAAAGEVAENGTVSHLPIKFSAPFSLNVNCNTAMPSTAELDCIVTPIDNEIVMDSEKLTVSCMLKIRYRVTNTDTVKRICECNAVGDKEYKTSLSSIVVYYPSEHESLFEIAKKFHTTGSKIAHDNELSEQTISTSGDPVSLFGVKKLIIR